MTEPFSLEERLFVIKAIKRSSSISKEELHALLLDGVPGCTVSFERLHTYVLRIYLGAVVPAWFHNVLSSQLQDEETCVLSPRSVAIVRSAIPEELSPSFPDLYIGFIGHLWRRFCVNPTRSFPDLTFCKSITEGQRAGQWRLTSEQFDNYLDYLYILEEHRFRPFSSLSPHEINTDIVQVFDEWTAG